jgi:DNA modification methylase
MILREERIAGQRLLLGDSLAILPTLGRVDSMLTDPPYGIGDIMVGSGHFAGLCKRMGGDDGWDKSPPPKWVFENDFPTIAWGGNYLGLPPSRGWLAWVKNNAAPTFAAIELAWTNMDFNAKHWIGPVGCPQSEKAGHPTQKPVALMEWCLGFLPNAQTVLDPFMGSGTTLVACQRMGRQGIGVERDPQYFDIACRRVDEASRQPDLFLAPAPPAPTQEVLL